jgi:hypothetical protein
MDETRLQRLQALLQRYELPAWLLCDSRHSNPIAYQVLGLDPTLHCTRRWSVLIPAQGQPEKLLHCVEPHVLQDVPARERLYATYGEWQRVLHEWVQRYRRLALEYSPRGELPTISLVDGGTVELLRFFGAELHSSADLVQELLAVHSEQQLRQLAETAQQLRVLVWEAFAWIGEQLRRGESPQEYAVQQLLLQRLRQQGLVTDHPPIVARTERAANPHYAPTAQDTAPIRLGDLVLIDIWAKPNAPDALYADITLDGVRRRNCAGSLCRAVCKAVRCTRCCNRAHHQCSCPPRAYRWLPGGPPRAATACRCRICQGVPPSYRTQFGDRSPRRRRELGRLRNARYPTSAAGNSRDNRARHLPGGRVRHAHGGGSAALARLRGGAPAAAAAASYPLARGTLAVV